MQKKRCYLCGGKLVKGVCVDCGLDNRRNDRKSYRLNSTTAEFASDRDTAERDTTDRNTADREVSKAKPTEVQKVNPKTKQKSSYVLQQSSVPKKDKNKQVRKKAKNAVEGKKKRPRRVVKIILFTILAIYILPVILEVGMDGIYRVINQYESHKRVQEEFEDSSNYEEDIYENVTYDLPSSGEKYEIELTSGNYKIGVHIPEGNYSIDQVGDSGFCRVKDEKNRIYKHWWLSDQEESLKNGAVQTADDVRLYQGAEFLVDDGTTIRLTTECAQMDKMIPLVENPLSEKILLKEGDKYTVGKDFPAGIYDLVCEKDFVGMDTNYDDSLELYWASMENKEGFKNIYLLEGTIVQITDGEGALIPSKMIESQDYTP